MSRPARLSHVRRWLGLALGALLLAAPAVAQRAWPPLPTEQFLSGRVATQEDVTAGRALFQLDPAAAPQPIEIEIPQYAIHRNQDSGQDEGVILLQAETAGGQNLVGYRRVHDQELGADLLESFELLGTSVPSRPVPLVDPLAVARADYTSDVLKYLRLCSGESAAQRELCACYESGKGSKPVGVTIQVDAQGLPTAVEVPAETEYGRCVEDALLKTVLPAPPDSPWTVQLTLEPNPGG